jgi:hypothetical protein
MDLNARQPVLDKPSSFVACRSDIRAACPSDRVPGLR